MLNLIDSDSNLVNFFFLIFNFAFSSEFDGGREKRVQGNYLGR